MCLYNIAFLFVKNASFVYFSFGLFLSLTDLLKSLEQSDINPVSILCCHYLFPGCRLSFPFIISFGKQKFLILMNSNLLFLFNG